MWEPGFVSVQLHNAVAEMEREKFDLQKRHTESIQELLEDTNARLRRMEGEYTAQTQATASPFPLPAIASRSSLLHVPSSLVCAGSKWDADQEKPSTFHRHRLTWDLDSLLKWLWISLWILWGPLCLTPKNVYKFVFLFFLLTFCLEIIFFFHSVCLFYSF